jgi:hypothetical protein
VARGATVAPSCRRSSRFWAKFSVLGEGDALVVTRLDRLGRSIRDLANIAHEIEQAGAHLKVIEQSVDTSTAAGRAFYAVFDPQQKSRLRRMGLQSGPIKQTQATMRCTIWL